MLPRLSTARSLICLALLCLPRTPSAQAGSGLGSGCPDCEIELTRIVTLGGINDPGGVTQADQVAVDSQGRYVVANVMRSELTVFDRAGTYIRTVGRSGGGPGEFRNIAAIWARGDSINILDAANRRLTVLGPAFEVVRTARIPTAASEIRAIPLDAGRILMNATLPTPGHVGLPLHVISPDGEVVRSFGADDEAVLPGHARADGRILARAGTGSVWAGQIGSYTLDLWSLEGRHIRTLVRRPEWFPESRTDQEYDPADPPRPFLKAIRLNQDGTLLTVTIVADERWTDGAILTRANGTGRIVGWRPDRADRLFDSMIEVMDTRSNTLLKTVRFEGYISQLLPGALAVASHADENGVEYLDILKLDWQPTPAGGED